MHTRKSSAKLERLKGGPSGVNQPVMDLTSGLESYFSLYWWSSECIVFRPKFFDQSFSSGICPLSSEIFFVRLFLQNLLFFVRKKNGFSSELRVVFRPKYGCFSSEVSMKNKMNCFLV